MTNDNLMKTADMKVIKYIIKEYFAHDLEAFNTRTEIFRIAYDLAEEVERLRKQVYKS